MKEFIDKQAIIKKVVEDSSQSADMLKFLVMLKKMPTTKAVTVTRCADCENWMRFKDTEKGLCWINTSITEPLQAARTAYDYCSLAKRKS